MLDDLHDPIHLRLRAMYAALAEAALPERLHDLLVRLDLAADPAEAPAPHGAERATAGA